MEALKSIAVNYNLTVILTIHQPSARLFQTIDRVVFLSAGHITFFDDSSKLKSYAEDLCAKLGVESAGGNAPELYLDICDQLSAAGKVDQLFVSDFIASNVDTFPQTPPPAAAVSTVGDVYANSFLEEVAILFHRGFINVLRTPELFLARLTILFVGFQMGTLFLFTANTDKGISYRAAFFTFTLATFYWTSLEALPIFFAEREIFMREFSRGAYRGISYAVASWLVDFPALIFLAVSYAIMTWWMVGLPKVAERFFFFAFQCFMALLSGQTFATMLSTVMPDPMTGQTVGSTLFAVMFVFSGYFITRDDMPLYWYAPEFVCMCVRLGYIVIHIVGCMYVCLQSPIHSTYEYYYGRIWTCMYVCDARLLSFTSS